MKIKVKVGAIIHNQNNEVLLIKEYSKKKKGFFWNIIKGTINQNDKDMLEALSREIFEEIGLLDGTYIVQGLFGTYDIKRDTYMSSLSVYEVYSDRGNNFHLANNLENELIESFAWFNTDKLKSMDENCFFDVRIYQIIGDYLEYEK